jgi:hypothetical protein
MPKTAPLYSPRSRQLKQAGPLFLGTLAVLTGTALLSSAQANQPKHKKRVIPRALAIKIAQARQLGSISYGSGASMDGIGFSTGSGAFTSINFGSVSVTPVGFPTGNVTVSSGGTLVVGTSSNLISSRLENLTIQSGGTLKVDGLGLVLTPSMTINGTIVVAHGILSFADNVDPESSVGRLKATFAGLIMPPPEGMIYVASGVTGKVVSVPIGTSIDSLLADLNTPAPTLIVDPVAPSALTGLDSSSGGDSPTFTSDSPSFDTGLATPAAVPEPSAALLAGVGLSLLGLRRRR